MADAQVHMVPFDGFAFANSRANDLCLRTLASNQKIILSPARSNPDVESSTLTIDLNRVVVSGHLNSTGTLSSSDVDTLAIRLRKAASPAAAGGSAVAEVQRLRVGIIDAGDTPSMLLDTDANDVIIVRDNADATMAALQPTAFSLASRPNINGRRFTVKNCRATQAISINVLALTGLLVDGATTSVAPMQEANFYGALDQWR